MSDEEKQNPTRRLVYNYKSRNDNVVAYHDGRQQWLIDLNRSQQQHQGSYRNQQQQHQGSIRQTLKNTVRDAGRSLWDSLWN